MARGAGYGLNIAWMRIASEEQINKPLSAHERILFGTQIHNPPSVRERIVCVKCGARK